MNYSMILYVLQTVIRLEGLLMIPPLVISLACGETDAVKGFGLAIIIMVVLMIPWTGKRKKTEGFGNKDAIAITGLAWIVMSLLGALPFFLSGEIPNYIDALFETVSGFTTTGASILSNVESMSRGLLFWRSFTHWIGGMGVLVFLLAIMPLTGRNRATSIHLLRAESPGPLVDKVRPKMLDSAKMLYRIYIGLTIAQFLLLLCGGMNVFDDACITMGTAGTGGFAVLNDSLASYSPYIQWVVTLFMILFALNFNVYVYMLAKNWHGAFRSEEVWVFIGIFTVSTLVMTGTLVFQMDLPFSEAIRAAAFQAASIMSTTGYTTMDFNVWPILARSIILIIMVIGACAGSTGGGIKVSRILLLFKSMKNYLRRQLHPREVRKVRLDGSVVAEDTIYGVCVFMILWLFIVVFGFLLVSIDGQSLETNFSAVLTTISNVGPGFDAVGPTANFALYSNFSKIVLCMLMLIGRLEIIPIVMLFTPALWKKK